MSPVFRAVFAASDSVPFCDPRRAEVATADRARPKVTIFSDHRPIKRYLIGLCEMQFSAQTTDKADADCDGGDLRASENERRGTLARFPYVARSPCVAAEFHGDLLM